MPGQIQTLMLKEHERISKFLEQLEKEIDHYDKTKLNFNKFKWNLEKHFFVEEKVIFSMFVNISGKETTDTFSLLSDHVKIVSMINNIENKLKNKIRPDLSRLKEVLIAHKDFENQEFYPKLDERLNPAQKKEISERVKEIISG